MATQKNHKSLIFLISMFLLGIILFATNPSKERFKEYIKEDIQKKAYQEDQLSGAIMELLAGPTSWMAGAFTQRQDFIFFSTYEVELSKDDKAIYIGILNTFFQIR